MSPTPVAALLVLVAVVASGCGAAVESEEGATLTVYVSAPLSGKKAQEGRAAVRGAKGALARADGRAGPWRLRAVYMDDTGGGETWTLAQVGANARRASEDSAAIAYVGDLDPRATRFSLPITSEAELLRIGYRPDEGVVPAAYGREAVKLLIAAIREAGGEGADRAAVAEAAADLIVRDGEPPGLTVELPGG